MWVQSENSCSRKNGIKALIPPREWLPWRSSRTKLFLEALSLIFPLHHRNRQASDLKRVSLWKKLPASSPAYASRQSPSPRRPASIRPSSLKHQESLYLNDWKSATNLATKCWDIFSFHVCHFFVVVLGGDGVSWKGRLFSTCTQCTCFILFIKCILALCGCWQWWLSKNICWVSERLGSYQSKRLRWTFAEQWDYLNTCLLLQIVGKWTNDWLHSAVFLLTLLWPLVTLPIDFKTTEFRYSPVHL